MSSRRLAAALLVGATAAFAYRTASSAASSLAAPAAASSCSAVTGQPYPTIAPGDTQGAKIVALSKKFEEFLKEPSSCGQQQLVSASFEKLASVACVAEYVAKYGKALCDDITTRAHVAQSCVKLRCP